MDDPFAKRGFIVTGAASGIGLATAKLLKEHGARLMLWDRSAQLETVANELRAPFALLDVTDVQQVQTAMENASRQLETIHGVIHCAGVLRTGLFEEIGLEAHQEIIAVNLIGTLNVT
jgi:NADP-dependent 3-hydroxy acid dehydrogenase YdfG